MLRIDVSTPTASLSPSKKNMQAQTKSFAILKRYDLCKKLKGILHKRKKN
jgi:hypothetical protein